MYAGASTIVNKRAATMLVLLSSVLLAPSIWHLASLAKVHPISWDDRPLALGTVVYLGSTVNLLMPELKEWHLTGC